MSKPQNRFYKNVKRLYRLYDAGAVFTAFDTETTSLTPATGRIIEIGAVKFSCDGTIDVWESLFSIEQEIPPLITKITGITQQMTAGKPPISERIDDFLCFIKDTVIVAHNAQFDLNFLSAECERCQRKMPDNHIIDTLQCAREVFPNQKHKLSVLARELNIDPGSSHRAMDDANTCKELFECIVRLTRPKQAVQQRLQFFE